MITTIHTLKKRTWRQRLFTFPWNPLRSHSVVLENLEEDAWRQRFTKPAVWRKRDQMRQSVRATEPAPFMDEPAPFSRSFLTSPQLPLKFQEPAFVSGGGGVFDGGGASGRYAAAREEALTVIEHAKTEPMPLSPCIVGDKVPHYYPDSEGGPSSASYSVSSDSSSSSSSSDSYSSSSSSDSSSSYSSSDSSSSSSSSDSSGSW